MNAIETKNLTKVYSNNFTAVNSLNLEIPEKTIFGMLGPNGAGKPFGNGSPASEPV